MSANPFLKMKEKDLFYEKDLVRKDTNCNKKYYYPAPPANYLPTQEESK